MSAFSDFDEFLRDQEAQKQRATDEQFELLKQSRKQLDPLLRNIFALFKEYYETILLPRRPYLLILKKHESLDSISKDSSANFLYRANLIPREILPGAFDPSWDHETNHLTLHKITQHDWHFEVSLQLDIAFVASPLSDKFIPKLILLCWGQLPSEQQRVLPGSIKLSEHTAWRHPYIAVEISGGEQTLREELQRMLMLLTPNIFAHVEEMWKRKR